MVIINGIQFKDSEEATNYIMEMLFNSDNDEVTFSVDNTGNAESEKGKIYEFPNRVSGL